MHRVGFPLFVIDSTRKAFPMAMLALLLDMVPRTRASCDMVAPQVTLWNTLAPTRTVWNITDGQDASKLAKLQQDEAYAPLNQLQPFVNQEHGMLPGFEGSLSTPWAQPNTLFPMVEPYPHAMPADAY